jgi:PKD repeat protein
MKKKLSHKLASKGFFGQLAALLPRLTPRITNTTSSRTPLKTDTKMLNTTICGLIFSLFFAFPLLSQTPIAGQINHYAKVTEINACEGKLVLANATAGFSAGDPVLLIQMKGATINESNGSSFGNIQDIGSAGFYERNEILSITGPFISLKYNLVNTYDVNGLVQLVTMPAYEKAVVTDTLKAAPWNGQSGGIIALSVSKKLTLQAPIDASAKGFRGGSVNVANSDCNFLTNADDYYYNMTNWRGAPKGEGIAAFISGKEQGRGPQANGGGGGNDHNAGGGGGANTANGGTGGKQSASGFGCDGNNPGKEGKPVPNEPNRLFFGGGGGAGHVDDNGAGSRGGNGGGIVIIITDSLEANGHGIFANGETPGLANGDGAGGGGAGGTIVLKANNIAGFIFLEAKGGNGGRVSNPSNRCFGAGGAGSGGRFLTNTNLNSVNLEGGKAGINTNPSNECGSPSNGAEDGNAGLQDDFSNIPASNSQMFTTSILSQPASVQGCEGAQVSFEFVVQGFHLDYQWQVNAGSGWEDIEAGNGYSGFSTSVLTIFNPQPSMDNYKFRCLVTGECTADILSLTSTLTLVPSTPPSFSYDLLSAGSYQFNSNAPYATAYVWDFGDGETSTEPNPQHSFTTFGDYQVTLTVTGPCGAQTVTQAILVATAPTAGFMPDVTSGCVPMPVQFINTSSANAESYQWYFPGGTPSESTAQHPVVTYSATGQYGAILVVSNALGVDTIAMQQLITVNDVPEVDFDANVNGLTVSFVNFSLNAAGGYLWDFGDGTTGTAPNPDHVYPGDGVYNVTLTAFNACGEQSFSQSVPTGLFPQAKFSASFDGGCEPMTVYFSNQSTGGNISGYSWSFPGGIPATSNEANPVVSYPSAGVYDVFLTVANPIGDHTSIEPGFVVVKPTPVSNFEVDIDGKTVYFTNNSVDGDYYYWDFGDGNTSTEVNPVHTYALDNIYSVTLSSSNNFCGSAIAQEIIINVTGVQEELLDEVAIFPNPAQAALHVELAGNSLGTVSGELWDPNGRAWRQFEFVGNKTALDIADLPAGVYFLSLKSGTRSERWKVLKF